MHSAKRSEETRVGGASGRRETGKGGLITMRTAEKGKNRHQKVGSVGRGSRPAVLSFREGREAVGRRPKAERGGVFYDAWITPCCRPPRERRYRRKHDFPLKRFRKGSRYGGKKKRPHP